MEKIIHGALRKFDKVTREQAKNLLISTANEIARLEAALNSIDSGLMVCDNKQRLIFQNRWAERFVPVHEKEKFQAAIWTVVENKEIAQFLQEKLQNQSRVLDKEFSVMQNGVERRLSIKVLPLVDEHHITGSLLVIDDITEKRERASLERRIETLASLTTLAAGVAHEIKNPLGSISIYIQLAKKALSRSRDKCMAAHSTDRENPTPIFAYDSLENYLKIVTDEIERLNKIVVDFLFTVRPMKMELKLGNINILLKELVEFYHFELKAQKIKIVLNFDDNIPFILLNEQLLKQAFLNLFQNAKEAMQKGGALTIHTDYAEDKVIVSIEDTGVGIADDDIIKIFEPYWTTKPTGSGLGLMMVFKIITEHGGVINVHSHEGSGTRFDIIFPAPSLSHVQLTYENK